MGQSPAAFDGGQIGTEIIDEVLIILKPWQTNLCNPSPAPLLAPDDSWGAAPVNDASVTDNAVTSEIAPPSENYEQPGTAAPAANPAITISAKAPPNQIEVTEGVNYEQPNTAAPAANPQIGAPARNLNPMGL